MIKANYLFNTVSRKKLDYIEMEFKSRIPHACKYRPHYQFIMERPYQVDFSKSKMNHLNAFAPPKIDINNDSIMHQSPSTLSNNHRR